MFIPFSLWTGTRCRILAYQIRSWIARATTRTPPRHLLLSLAHTHTHAIGWRFMKPRKSHRRDCNHKICVQIAHTRISRTPTKSILFRLKYCAQRKSTSHGVAFQIYENHRREWWESHKAFCVLFVFEFSSRHTCAPMCKWECADGSRSALRQRGRTALCDCNWLIIKLTHLNIISCMWNLISYNYLWNGLIPLHTVCWLISKRSVFDSWRIFKRERATAEWREFELRFEHIIIIFRLQDAMRH